MKFFQEVQKNFAILGISKNQSMINRNSVLACLIYGVGTSFSTIFLFQEANNFQEYTTNIYITTSLAVAFTYYTIMLFKMEKLFALIHNMEKTLNKKSKNPTSKAIYKHINRFVEKLSRFIHFVIAIVSPVCYIFPKATLSYFMFFATNLGDEAFELPLFYWFPFNWKNPIGYFLAAIIEYVTMLCHFTFLACAITFGVGVFCFALSAADDGKNDLRIINENAKIQRKRLQTLKQISDFVQIHSIFKQYIDDFLDIYQPIFMIIYVWSLATICGVMLLIQIELQGNGSLALLIITIFYVFYAIGIMLTICELGQRLSEAFEEIDDTIEAFDWNLFSLEIQKMLPMILMVVQRPVELHIFGSTSGLRDTFKKVINNAYSYFTVIRQFLK